MSDAEDWESQSNWAAELDHWAAEMAAGAPVGAAGDVGECVSAGAQGGARV